MRLREIIRFEIGCQSRRVSTWAYSVVLLMLMLYITGQISTDHARSAGTYTNDPYFVASTALLGSLMGLVIVAAFAGDAAARDVQTRTDALIYTMPLTKADYLGGRFLAAFSLCAITLLTIPAALILSFFLTDSELAGPFRPGAYLGAYLYFVLPNAFVAASLLFAVAALSRRAMASYAGGVLVFGLCLFSYVFLALTFQRWALARLLDPMGVTALAELGRLWTPAEKGTRLIPLEGSLLWNRLLWIGISLIVLTLTAWRVRLAHHARGSWFAVRNPTESETPIRDTPVRLPRHVDRKFGPGVRMRQAIAIARDSFRDTVTGWGGLICLAVLVIAAFNGQQLRHMGVPFVATVERVTSVNTHWPIIWLVIAFCAGELIWREREARVNEITDAAPVPEWVSFLGKFTGLSLVVVVLQALVMAAGMVDQVLLGHRDLQMDLYIRILLGLQLSDYLLIAVLALVVHTIVNQKYVAHLFVVIAMMMVPARDLLGIEHNLLLYGADPGWSYTDMRGFEPSIGPWFWFTLYWTAWALLLTIAATLFQVRGKEEHVRARASLFRQRLTRRVAMTGAAVMALVLTVGGFVFYNTNVLNAYPTVDLSQWRADYERRYGRFKGVPQPQVTSVRLAVEIFPRRRSVDVSGTLGVVNKGRSPLDTIHVATPFGVETLSLEFDRAWRTVQSDEELRHRIYTVEPALQPGESLELRFAVRRAPRGFRNDGIDAAVVDNGTYFRIEQWMPAIGYQPERELRTDAERRAHGLAARASVAVLHDVEARLDSAQAGRVAFEAVVGTDEGQLAVAPGRLRRTWTERGRRYFRYVTDAPIRENFAFFSADYAVREARWNDVLIQIVHHPAHAWNVDRMVRSVQQSLEYFTRRFGPYPHTVVRLVEQPGDSVVLHASPVNISYEEPFALLNPGADSRSIDLPFAVVAHEVAHTWWGHTVTPARVEGGVLLTESLAWYSALALVEETLGRDHVWRLLRMMHEAYLQPQPRANVPLLRADDWFLGYRKGPFAMWALRQYLGAAPVDRVLQRLIAQYGSGDPPLPTSLDLYRELQAITPDHLRYLLVDLFETNTFWELESQRVSARRISSGEWQVTLDVFARKVAVDEKGVETEVPMDDLIEVGVFTTAEDAGEPQFLRLQRVRSGQQRIVFTVPERPLRAGIDPRNLMIDLDAFNNFAEVTR